MTAHEWKPGDLAVITEYGTEIPAVMVEGACCESGHVRSGHWHYFAVTPDGATWTSKEQPAARPLVVIDPESPEDVARLADAFCNARWSHLPGGDECDPLTRPSMKAALREFATPKPPKLPQPTGKYAVVEDEHGLEWVLADPSTTLAPWKCLTSDRWAPWSEVAAVEVLSEGRPS